MRLFQSASSRISLNGADSLHPFRNIPSAHVNEGPEEALTMVTLPRLRTGAFIGIVGCQCPFFGRVTPDLCAELPPVGNPWAFNRV